MSGNIVNDQGNLERTLKVREKSGNLKWLCQTDLEKSGNFKVDDKWQP